MGDDDDNDLFSKLTLEAKAPEQPVRNPPEPDEAFDGDTYVPDRDHVRMNAQLLRVFDLMKDGQPRTLSNIRLELSRRHPGNKDSEAAISARLRDLRKDKWGAYKVERKNLGGGLHSYAVIV